MASMPRSRCLFGIVALAFLGLGALALDTAAPAKKLCKGNITKVLMQLKPDAARRGVAGRLTADKELGVRSWKHVPNVNVDIAEVNCEASEEAAEAALKAIKDKYGDSLLYAELDKVIKPVWSKGAPPAAHPRKVDPTELDDTYWADMWDMTYINMEEAWSKLDSLNNDPSEVVVAVIDTGVQIDHPDLVNNIWTNPNEIPGNGIDDDGNGYIDDVNGWDFTLDSATVIDEGGHGTHCAGTIAAEGANGIGVVGVAGINAKVKILPLRTMSPATSFLSDAIRAIDYTLGLGVMVSSNSWGLNAYSEALGSALNRANDAGQLFVTAASNEGENNDEESVYSYPCEWPSDNIICVASVSEQDALASNSNYGATTVDIAAPGVLVPSTVPTDTYDLYSGTSMATPHVAGAAGLLLSNFDYLTAMEVKEMILATAVHKNYLDGIVLTGGVMDVSALVTEATEAATTEAATTAAATTAAATTAAATTAAATTAAATTAAATTAAATTAAATTAAATTAAATTEAATTAAATTEAATTAAATTAAATTAAATTAAPTEVPTTEAGTTLAPATDAPVPPPPPTGEPSKPTIIPKPGQLEFCLTICEASHCTWQKKNDCQLVCQEKWGLLQPFLNTYCQGGVCGCSRNLGQHLLDIDEMTNEVDVEHSNLLQVKHREALTEEETCIRKDMWCNSVCATAVCPMSMKITFDKCHKSCMDPSSQFSVLMTQFCV